MTPDTYATAERVLNRITALCILYALVVVILPALVGVWAHWGAV